MILSINEIIRCRPSQILDLIVKNVTTPGLRGMEGAPGELSAALNALDHDVRDFQEHHQVMSIYGLARGKVRIHKQIRCPYTCT